MDTLIGSGVMGDFHEENRIRWVFQYVATDTADECCYQLPFDPRRVQFYLSSLSFIYPERRRLTTHK